MPRTAPSVPKIGEGKIVQRYKTKEQMDGQCKVIMTFRERRLIVTNAETGVFEDGAQWIEYNTKIKAMQHHTRGSAVVIAQFCETYKPTGFLSSNPFVTIGKTLPSESSVFSLVAEGDVEGLQTLITRGEATLRDRNCFGTPLLHVSEPSVGCELRLICLSMRQGNQECASSSLNRVLKLMR